MAGNAVPVPYFTALLSKVIQALNNAGVQRHTNGSKDTLYFSDLSLEETSQKELVKGPTLEQCKEIQQRHQAFVTKLFADAKSPVKKTQQGTIWFTADSSVGGQAT